jgi:hypothetical protein
LILQDFFWPIDWTFSRLLGWKTSCASYNLVIDGLLQVAGGAQPLANFMDRLTVQPL